MSNIEERFQELYEKYYSDVYRFLLKWTNGNVSLSEELVQETFFQVFLSLHRYRGECNVKTWICKIAMNIACKYHNKNPKQAEFTELISVETKENPEEIALHNEDLRKLRLLVKQLNSKYREVVIYRIYFEMSFAEISNMMKISENSAKVLFHRAKEILRKKWSS